MTNATTTAGLPQIAGLDTAAGLRTLNGNQTAYLRLLRRFAADHGDDMTALRAELARDEQETARRIAHTLKGAAGNLGATGVQRRAAELEAAIKANGEATILRRLTDALEAELRPLAAALRAALPEDDAAAEPPPEIDWPGVKRLLVELELLLTGADMRANKLFADHAPLLRAALGPAADDIVRHLDHYDYPEALAALRGAGKMELPHA